MAQELNPDPTILIKGVPANEIIKMLAEDGCHYQDIIKRYRVLDYRDIGEAVRFRNYRLVPIRLQQGKTPKEIAREFGFTVGNIRGIMRKIERDQELKKNWGGLSYRTVKAIRKAFGSTSLQHFIENLPTEEELMLARGIGGIALDELRSVLAEKFIYILETPIYNTKIKHFPRPPYEPSLPRKTLETAQFFHGLIEAADKYPVDVEASSQVPCMASPRRRWCLGIISVIRKKEPFQIHWRCPKCGLTGVLTD